MSENEKLTRELDVACLVLQTRLHNQEAVTRYINRDDKWNDKWNNMLRRNVCYPLFTYQ